MNIIIGNVTIVTQRLDTTVCTITDSESITFNTIGVTAPRTIIATNDNWKPVFMINNGLSIKTKIAANVKN